MRSKVSLLVSDRIPARAAALVGAALVPLAFAGSAVATPMTVQTQTLLTPPGGGLLTGYAPRTTGLEVGAPSASLNGQLVAYASNATDLGTTPPTGTTQIWLRNAQKGTTTLISRATKSTDSPLGEPGLGSSTHPSISGDGRFVVFSSKSSNLSADDADGTSDVYVRDTALNTTTLVSRASNVSGGAAGNGDSTEPVLSADGRYVAFTSAASNLAANDTNGQTDVFLRDLRRGVTYLLSLNKAGTASAAGASSAPSIAAYAKGIAFQSTAHDITGDDGATTSDIYVRYPAANRTELFSRATGATGGAGELGSYNPSISADAGTVAFESRSVALTPLQNPPLISQVFVRQRATALTLLVSRAEGQTGGAADRDATNASISPDGLYVAFASAGTGLTNEDDDGLLGLVPSTDVFVRDLVGGSTTLVSRKGVTSAGAPGAVVKADSGTPFLGTTANFVLFSTAADLGPLPTGKGTNLYSAKLQLPLSVTASAPITVGYRRFDTVATCSATCSIYVSGVLTTTVNGVTSSKGSYIFGGKTPVPANTPTRIAVSVWNTQISNWLKAALDKGGSATIKLTVAATGLRGEQSKAVVEAPVVIPTPAPTPTPTPTPAAG